jgi:hypothetical protein
VSPGQRATLARSRGAKAVPCVNVTSVPKAIQYYQRFFALRPVWAERDRALLRGHGALIGLREGAPAHGQVAPAAWLIVADPARLRLRLDDLGAHLVPPAELGLDNSPQWTKYFGVRDCYGNVLAVGPAAGFTSGLVRRAAGPVDSGRRAVDRWRTARAESQRFAAFRRQRTGTTGRHPTFFLHANGGLVHWLAKTASYVPDDVDLVLLGSDLSVEERDWVARHLGRPFHHVDLRLDDAGAWELVCAAELGDFGWLDLGCLVLDPAVFGELAEPRPGVSFACAWSWDPGLGFPIASPYLMYSYGHARVAVRAAGSAVTPGVYAYDRINRQVEGRRCYSRTPSRSLRRILSQLLPPAEGGRPAVPGDSHFFDTTVVYQLVAMASGQKLARIRDLRGGAEAESCDELFYISGLAYADVLEEFSGFFHDPGVRLRYLLAEYLALAPVASSLPGWYGMRLAGVVEALAQHGLTPQAASRTAWSHLVQDRGLSPTAADLICGTAGPDPAS